MPAYKALEIPIPIKNQVWPSDVQPVVSVRVMVYNHKEFLEQCLNSILEQRTTFPVQVLVHEDCSTDGSIEILRNYQKKFKNQITVYFQKQNTYASPLKHELRRPFFNLIKGEFIAVCESDDYWTDNEKLLKQVAFLLKNPSFSAVATNFNVVNYLGENVVIQKVRKNDILFDDHQQQYVYMPKTLTLLQRNYKEHLNVMMLFKEITNGDVANALFLRSKGKIGFINEVTGAYRLHGGGVYSSLSIREKTEKTLDSFLKMIKICETNQIVHDLNESVNIYYHRVLALDLLHLKLFVAKQTITALRSSKELDFRISVLLKYLVVYCLCFLGLKKV